MPKPGRTIRQVQGPYRLVQCILTGMAKGNALDADVVDILVNRRADMDAIRREAQTQALKNFERFAKAETEFAS